MYTAPRGSPRNAHPTALKASPAAGPGTGRAAWLPSAGPNPKPPAPGREGARYQARPRWSVTRVVTGLCKLTESVTFVPATAYISPVVVPSPSVASASLTSAVVVPRLWNAAWYSWFVEGANSPAAPRMAQ